MIVAAILNEQIGMGNFQSRIGQADNWNYYSMKLCIVMYKSIFPESAAPGFIHPVTILSNLTDRTVGERP
jgi:hypothetical protein